MARLGYAERHDVKHWGTTRAAAGDLPQLVRRLILETAPVTKLGFAAAEGVGVGGWDGTVRSRAETAHVPTGLSLWELSTHSSPGTKADDDFNKRLATPDGSPAIDAVYVAVSTRPWTTRADFVTRAVTVGRWREVRAYALDELHGWLDEAPVTHAWLSELMGHQPHGLVTAERWWHDWSGRTDPALSPAVVLAGREGQVEAAGEVMAGVGRLVTVAAPSRDDAFAFLAAAAVAAAADDGALIARMAFIDRAEAWRRLREHHRPLMLVPLNDEVAADMASGSMHHVFIPAVGADSGDVILEPIDAQQAAAALRAAGLGEEIANEVGQLARLSLLAGRRRIAVKPELHRPTWATAPVDRIARRVILLGRFSEGSEADRACVAQVLGLDFEEAAEKLAGYMSGEDPLLARFATTLAIVSPFDAWLLDRRAMHREDFEAFQKAALAVLTELDPAYELDHDERWLANVRGKVRAHSHDLRRGIATTLALLGGHGEIQIAGAPLMAREWGEWIVRDVLEASNKDKSCQLWASLGDVLSLLAEAAPDEFVDAVRVGLQGEPPLLVAMFEDSGDVSPMFTSSAHTALLWALEIISWSPKHLGAVVDLLARLDEVDPGGNVGNRPLASLMSIFRPWFPQTSVGTERRLEILDRMRERHPEVAWKLLKRLVLERTGGAMHMSGPRFREWRPADIEPTPAEYWSEIEALFARVLEDANADAARLSVLVDGLPNLPPTSRSALLTRLDGLYDELGDAGRPALWSTMRAEAAKSREFADAKLALPEEDVLRLEALVARFQPDAPTVRLRWLFAEHTPSIPGVSLGNGLDEYQPKIDELRADAAREIAVASDWGEFLAFARDVKLSWFLGAAVANARVRKFEPQLLALLDVDDVTDSNLAASYFARRFRGEGWKWLDGLLAGELTARQRARLLLVTDDYPATWRRAEDAGGDVALAFWAEFPVGGHGADFAEVDEVAEKMLAAGAVVRALDLLNLYHRGEPTLARAELVARGLELMLENPDRVALEHLSQYGLRNLFEYMERAGLDEERLARLEWSYLPVFGYDVAPPTLSRHLAASPEFFAEAIGRIFRPGDEEDDEEPEEARREEPSEQELAVASNAHHLISSWRTLPGRDGDSVDAEVLTLWVERARELLCASRRLRVGDLHIGKLLASGPPDPDGAWPCQAVRDVLESVESEEIERGFEGEIFGSLGVTTRGVLDGGDQERDRARLYREQAERFYDRWPRTAKVLNEAADDFDRAARRYDADAERRRTGLD